MSFMGMPLLDWATTLMLLAGGFFVFVGGLGAIRLPDLYTRLHATSLTDTLGSLLIIGALILQAGFSLVALKLLAVMAYLLLTSPVSAYALANAAYLSGHLPAGLKPGDGGDA